MVPVDWARALERPRRYLLPEERPALTDRYEALGRSPQLHAVLDDVLQHGASHAIVESPYVDFDYRSEFSHMYSRSFNPPSDKCERLLFFAQNEFLGFAVIRPSHKPVGRTAIAPPPEAEALACCLARHNVRTAGQRLAIEAFPFLSQDGQYGRCAHAAIWSVARYHHLRHGTGRHSIAAVVDAAGTREAVDRTFSSGGLYLHEVARAFHSLGLPTFMYDPAKYDPESLVKVVCRYLNSGFPVVLNTEAHLTVLTGYGYEDGQIVFLRSDDNLRPYELIRNWEDQDPLRRWEMLLVPLPARIHVPAEAAEIAARRHMDRIAGAAAETLSFRQRLKDGEFRLRTYAVDAAEYKLSLANRDPAMTPTIIEHHQSVPLGAWVWVTEFQSKQRNLGDRAEVVAEIVIDATSHRARPRPLLANLPGRCVAWLSNEAHPRGREVERLDGYGSALPARPAPVFA